jgi:ethanolamine ammonia-lyase small subunit
MSAGGRDEADRAREGVPEGEGVPESDGAPEGDALRSRGDVAPRDEGPASPVSTPGAPAPAGLPAARRPADAGTREPVEPDRWAQLRRFTPARIALGRTGASQPTSALLAFSLAHAQARDAVHEPMAPAALAEALAAEGFGTLQVRSRAADRPTYLRRPDLGRRLDDASAARLRAAAGAGAPGGDASGPSGPDLVFVIADGLSALAVARHAVPTLVAARALLDGWTIGPVVIAEQARVALGDEAGELLRARAVALLVGERPGLSSPDSLGVYLTWAPRVGRRDAERNCISNIRPQGLACDEAARTLAALLAGARRLGATGISLKDDRDAPRIAG